MELGARGSVVVEEPCYKSEGRDPMRRKIFFFLIYLILPAALGPEVYSATNRNEYHKQKNNVSGDQSAAGEQGWQPYRHLWADCLDNVGS
jgi:hypothetical protein